MSQVTKKRRLNLAVVAVVIAILVIVAVVLFIVVRLRAQPSEPEPSPTVYIDPYEGMVQVADGAGGLMWAELHEELPVSTFESGDFYREDGFVLYGGENGVSTLRGIDVSFHQGEIDWELVAGAGVDFAMIRAGYRGYSAGDVYEDERFRANIEGAIAAGIKVGVYFFSQAVSVDEAREEARTVLGIVEGYELDFPVAFDWEEIGQPGARADEISGETLTDCAIAFCEVIEEAGYEPMVYFYRRLGYYSYDLSRLAAYKFWVSAPGDYPDFYYGHHMWQYSFTGSIEGIATDVDLNLCFG